MFSIIIPAHNEASVLTDSLRYLFENLPQEVDVVVVCNGCTDNSAEVAGQFARVNLVESPIPSKSKALNLGDSVASQFPRLYLDADVRLPAAAIEQMSSALSSGLLAVSPSVHMDMEGCSWAVRAYYEIWLQLPYCRLGMIGSGSYALSEQGRARFDQFPDIIADDGFVRALFTEDERGSVKAAAIVRAPADLGNLIKITTRSRLGRYELQQKFPKLIGNEEKKYGTAITQFLTKPLMWHKLLVYLYINLHTRCRARSQFRKRRYTWERDESRRGT